MDRGENIMDSISIAKQLDDHIAIYPEGSTMAGLLSHCKRMLANQADSMTEKDELIEALTASETLRIEQLKLERSEVARLKVFQKNKRAKRPKQ
jgi:hypothetical protein